LNVVVATLDELFVAAQVEVAADVRRVLFELEKELLEFSKLDVFFFFANNLRVAKVRDAKLLLKFNNYYYLCTIIINKLKLIRKEI